MRADDPLAKTIRDHATDKAVDMTKFSNLTEADILTLAIANGKARAVSSTDSPNRSRIPTGA
ncbi:MAG: hypothetical protein J0G95_15525 [Rhizobiales bacterium]|nr:hypothetical protein [Hyphomicrobiales bacterium]